MPPRIQASASFSQVCIRTTALLGMHIRPMLIGALSFALLTAVIVAAIGQKVGRIEEQITLSSGLTEEQLRSVVDDRVTVFTESDASMLMERFRSGTPPLSAGDTLTRDEAVFAFIVKVVPWLLLSSLLSGAIFFIACVFFLLLAAGGKQSPWSVTARLPGMILPMLGLSVWLFFRTFVWIPLIGWLLALYLFPRRALAPALLVANRSAGIRQSLRESMRRTKGRWLFLLISLIGAGLLSLGLLWFGIVFALVVATLFSMKLSFILSVFLVMIVAAFQMFFLTALAASVAETRNL